MEEADEVDIDLLDDLDLLRFGGLTDIDWFLCRGEDTGDIIGVEAGVITGDTKGSIEIAGTGSNEVGESLSSL